MGIQVEYNDVLALRGQGDEERAEVETIPPDLKEGETYDYRKNGYRILPLVKAIPLVQTKGGQNFEKVVALVSIQNVIVEADPWGDRIFTSGEYRVIKILDKKQSDQWLKILNDPLNL